MPREVSISNFQILFTLIKSTELFQNLAKIVKTITGDANRSCIVKLEICKKVPS